MGHEYVQHFMQGLKVGCCYLVLREKSWVLADWQTTFYFFSHGRNLQGGEWESRRV